MIAIVDYGMGNVRSLYNALQYIGCDAAVTSAPEEIQRAERLILPGVGAFGDAMQALRERGLDEILDQEVRRIGKPILGICLGMQLFAKSSEEHGIHAGLGWLDASVEKFRVSPPLKVPHVGWNSIRFAENATIFGGMKSGERNFYFVHSYHVNCHDRHDVIATTDYGGEFVASVQRDNIVAMQFHPEKSQDNGIHVLQNFLKWRP